MSASALSTAIDFLAKIFDTAPAVYFVAPAGALCAVPLMLGLPGDTWLRFGIWLIIGFAIYFFYGMRHSRMGNEPETA